MLEYPLGTFSSCWQMAGLPDGKEGRDLLGQTCKLWHPGGSLDTDFALDFAVFFISLGVCHFVSTQSKCAPNMCGLFENLLTLGILTAVGLQSWVNLVSLGVWPWFCWVKHRGIWVSATSTVTASPSIKWPKFGVWDSWAVTFFLNLVVHVSIHQPFPKHFPSFRITSLPVDFQLKFRSPWVYRLKRFSLLDEASETWS